MSTRPAIENVGSAALVIPAAQQDQLEAAYATPPRAYHDFGHVREVLRHCQDIAAGPGWHQPREVWLAALYHDAVYEAGRKDNEARSAQLAVAAIDHHLPHAGIDSARVAGLIALTARHGRIGADQLGSDAGAGDTRHFLDCDMAILGADPAVFEHYDRAIAEEYRGKVPGLIFRANRKRFLRRLLHSERIYLSDWFHQRLDAAARRNLRRVLEGTAD